VRIVLTAAGLQGSDDHVEGGHVECGMWNVLRVVRLSFGPVMPVVYGFRSMISTVVPGSPGAWKTNRVGQVKARVVSGEPEIGCAVVVRHGGSVRCW
jgi:hypothetical protein